MNQPFTTIMLSRVMQTDPESTCSERGKAAPEAGLLALGCDALVDAFTQPNVGLHVPGVK